MAQQLVVKFSQKALQGAGVACKLIPVPRHLSSDCGVCVRILGVDRERAVAALEEINMEIEGVYQA